MPSSGITGLSTNGDGAIALVPADGNCYTNILVINGSAYQGFWCVGDPSVAANWNVLPAASGGVSATVNIVTKFTNSYGLQVKRTPSGTDLTGLFASIVA